MSHNSPLLKAHELEAIWPGIATINREGLELARDMFVDLEWNDHDEDGISSTSYACLEDWPREGRPFRNVVAEYLQVARARGPDVEAGFCAALTDMIAMTWCGSPPDAERYDELGEKLVQS